jgi:NADH-quinone oxidoreductase subunit N
MRFSVVAREHQGRAYALLLFASAALLLMVSGSDLLVDFLAVECAALSCYFLCALPGDTGKPQPATINYVLASALGSAILAYGFSLVYAATAALNFSQSGSTLAHRNSFAQVVALSRQAGGRGEQMYRLLQERMPEALHWHPWMIKALPFAAFTVIVVALLVKMGALNVFPDARDSSDGIPTVFRAYLGSAVFAATMALLLRLLLTIFSDLLPAWTYVVEGLSCAAVLWGIAAAYQARTSRRMINASLLAHAGYLLMGLVAANERSLTGVNFYLFTNLFAIVGTFAILVLVAPRDTGNPDGDEVAGLAQRNGLAASLLTIFLFSLAGIPPTAGFLGRYVIVRALVETGHGSLAWFAGLTSLALAYFYLHAIVLVWRKTKIERCALNLDGVVVAMLAACLFVSLAAGLYAEPFTRLARYALGQ